MRACLLCAWTLLLALPAAAAEKNLDRWFERELVPYVATQLVDHPRFKGETVMFVVLADNRPAAVSNALALALRDRLLDAALNTAGVSIGSRQAGREPAVSVAAVDCTRDSVHYYVGIELARQIDGQYSVTVRALDLEDRNWVTGFGRSWQGRLNTVQRQALRQTRTDPTFRGDRDVPFGADESDLLAAHLAHELSCALLRETSASYVVATDGGEDSADGLDATVELVGNNLASHDAIELTDDELRVNARLSGKAHRIDGALFQYWLTVTPSDPAAELSTLSASAYIVLPGYRLANETPPEAPPRLLPRDDAADETTASARLAVSIPNAGDVAVLGPLQILESNDPATCSSERGADLRRSDFAERGRRCSLLYANARGDAIVFVVEHQASHGLVRLGDARCRERTAAHVVTRGAAMRYPIPAASVGVRETRAAGEWLVDPGVDTYYALAVSDARAARQFANLIDELPLRCGSTVRPGLTNNALQHWLDEFALLAARHARHVDWRAIEVKDVL